MKWYDMIHIYKVCNDCTDLHSLEVKGNSVIQWVEILTAHC